MPDFEYSRVISPNDHMWLTGQAWYFDVGLSAITCIRHALAAGRISPTSILDFPSGHGRVCRMLRAAYPEAHLAVCDLDRDGVDFCAREFKAEPLYSTENLEAVAVGRSFDLIWCGSLFTHLDRERWLEFLRFFSDRLSPDGVLVFTTHGRQPIQWMFDRVFDYGLTPNEQAVWIRQYADTGFGFISPANQAFGISLSSVAFVCDRLDHCPNLKLVSVHEAGWAGHQDVFACQHLRTAYPMRQALATKLQAGAFPT